MQGVHLRKYGVETKIPFVLYETDGVDLKVDAADGGTDCTIMKDEGAEATCTNDFVDEGNGYSITLTATEMQAARIVVYIIDSATKAYLDDALIIETYGNASAQHAVDFDDATRGGMTALPNANADAAGGLPISDAGGLDLDTKLANTNEVTAARMGALTDWINGGRLDLILDGIQSDAADALVDTNEMQGDLTDGGRLDLIFDAILSMLDDARAEPGQGAPPVNPDAMTKIDYLYKSWRNKKDNDGSTTQLYDDAGTTVDQKQTTSESGGTVTKAEWASGP